MNNFGARGCREAAFVPIKGFIGGNHVVNAQRRGLRVLQLTTVAQTGAGGSVRCRFETRCLDLLIDTAPLVQQSAQQRHFLGSSNLENNSNDRQQACAIQALVDKVHFGGVVDAIKSVFGASMNMCLHELEYFVGKIRENESVLGAVGIRETDLDVMIRKLEFGIVQSAITFLCSLFGV